jgi:hypothetical protein
MIDRKQVNIIKEHIRKGAFLEAIQWFKPDDYETLKQALFEIGSDEQNICSYVFICFLIQKREVSRYHSLASALLEISFCHLSGAYNAALYHTKRAYEISSGNIELQEQILLFNEIPEKVLSDEEALIIARDILKKKPDSMLAQEIVKQYERKN